VPEGDEQEFEECVAWEDRRQAAALFFARLGEGIEGDAEDEMSSSGPVVKRWRFDDRLAESDMDL